VISNIVISMLNKAHVIRSGLQVRFVCFLQLGVLDLSDIFVL
jgi:hypothetical protein